MKILEVYVHTREDIYCFDNDSINQTDHLKAMLINNAIEIIGITVSSNMTLEEYNKTYATKT